MNRRTVKAIVITASIVGLSGATAATAWADTFTPGIEEPTADLGLPGGNGNDLMGSTPVGGNKSSAAGTNGKSYGGYSSPYSSEQYYNSYNNEKDNGYWRSGSGYDKSGSDYGSDYGSSDRDSDY
jgi:hypothetical protein